MHQSRVLGSRHKKHLPKVITSAEAADLLAAAESGTAESCRDRLLLELLYRAGLRVSEVVKLTPRDVERAGLIRVYDAKGGDGTAYFDPPRVLPLLDRWLEVRSSWLNGVPSGTQHLFLKRDGSPLSTRYVQRLVKRLKDEIGVVGRCTPHTLRHQFATECIEEGFPIHEVQRLLRHANLATTAVYLSVRDESLRKRVAERSARVVT